MFFDSINVFDCRLSGVVYVSPVLNNDPGRIDRARDVKFAVANPFSSISQPTPSPLMDIILKTNQAVITKSSTLFKNQ